MGNLSEHFDSSEKLMYCPCCGQCEMNPVLIKKLEELRKLIGKPIKITSGYRCAKHNAYLVKTIHASPTSPHMKGNAADIKVTGIDIEKLFALACEVFADGGVGINAFQKYIHVDVGRKNPARWFYDEHNRYHPYKGKIK